MDLINKIDIQVTKAVITQVSFVFDLEKNGLPDIGIIVDLITAGNKKISTVNLNTKEYYGLKIDRDHFPASVDGDIASIMNKLNPIVGRRINQIENLIEA